jgi:hypothetical protein
VEAQTAPPAVASTAATIRAADAEKVMVAELAAPAPTAPERPETQTETVTAAPGDDAPGFMARHWHWLVALLALPLAGWLWAWVAHRRAYDDAGLPRGPRL